MGTWLGNETPVEINHLRISNFLIKRRNTLKTCAIPYG